MKGSKTWVFVAFGVILCGSILGGAGFLISRALEDMRSGEARLTDLCVERIGKVAKAQLLYAADHDETLPPAETWIDASWAYGESKGPKGKKIDPADTNESIFKCPAISSLRSGGYGYAFNRMLGSLKVSASDSKSILIFDSRILDRNGAGSPKKDLPVPIGRHDRGKSNVFAHLDGSVSVEPAK